MVQMKNHWINRGCKKLIRRELLEPKMTKICLTIFRDHFRNNLFLKRWQRLNLKWISTKLLRNHWKTLTCPHKKKTIWQLNLKFSQAKLIKNQKSKQLQLLKLQNKQLNKRGTMELKIKSYKKRSAKKTSHWKITKKLSSDQTV